MKFKRSKQSRLFEAVERRRLKTVCNLISRGANVNKENDHKGHRYYGSPVLHIAVENQDPEMVACLLDAGADVDQENRKGETALQVAVENFRYLKKAIKIVKMLIIAGSFPDCRRAADHKSLLHLVSTWVDPSLAKFLLEHGANPKARDNYCWTPLHYAMMSAEKDDAGALVEELLKAGVEVNAKDRQGESPVFKMVRYVEDHAYFYNTPRWENLERVLTALFKCGADFTLKNNDGVNPLEKSLWKRKFTLWAAMFEFGRIDVNIQLKCKSLRGNTILHEACWNQVLPLVRYLLKNGADVNALNEWNDSPLSLAIWTWNLDGPPHLVNYLLKWDPEFYSMDRSPLDVARTMLGAVPRHMNDMLLILVKHLALKHFLGKCVREDILRTVTNDHVEIWEACLEELEKLKAIQVKECTGLNILLDHKRKLMKYADNPEVVAKFGDHYFGSSYPVYGEKIKRRMDKAVLNRRTVDRAAEILSTCLPPPLSDPNHLVVRLIVNLIDMKNLRRLCESDENKLPSPDENDKTEDTPRNNKKHCAIM